MKNAIVIPCYNESKRIPLNQFDGFLKLNPDYQVCFVNDGSSDNTLEVLEDFALNHHNAVVLDMPQNGGKAEAVRFGINNLLERSNINTVGFLDADLSTTLNDYRTLCSKLERENKSLVFGSRKMIKNDKIQRSAFREFASFMVALVVRVILGLDIKDTQCGAKVFSRTAAQVAFKNSFISRWIFDVEVFIKLKKWMGKQNIMGQLTEYPLTEWNDVDGSKITLKDSIRMPMQLLKIGFSYNVKPIFTQSISLANFRKVVLKKVYSFFF